MKKVLLLAATVLPSLILFAQKDKTKNIFVSDFGKVDKTELELKECDFDNKAEAMVLFDVGELSCILSSTGIDLELVRHVRIKILQDRGRSNADIHIPFHSYKNDENIKDLSAQTYNLDASGNINVTNVDKKLIYEKQINKRFSEKVFTFPEVKAGSIVEYKYKLTGAGLVNWYFQRSIPVKYSQYKIDFPSEIEIYASPKCSLPYESNKDLQSTRNVQFFSMKNVPALRDEPFILNKDDYRERIESEPIAFTVQGRRISLLTTWPKIISSLIEDDDFGQQLKKDIPRTSDLDAQLNSVTDPYHRMLIIHKYVRENMQWNGYTGIWAQDGIKSAWKNKKGTVGEINLILINLLKDAGLKVHPVLVSTHDNGLVNTVEAGLNGYNQFNKVLAYVEIGDKVYILDATEKETPSYLIPRDVLLTEGLVIEKIETGEWGWKTLWNERLQSKNIIIMNGEIDENGKMTGEVRISSYDYARTERAEKAKKGAKEFTDQFLSSPNPGVSIDSVSFENLENDTLPLEQVLHFNQQLNSSGDYRYFTANMFTGFEKNPFIADTRFSDIFFGVNQFYSVIGTFYLPDGYKAEELPKNIRMIMPDTSIAITRMTQADATSISFHITLEFKKPFYTIAEYPIIVEFYKKLEALLNEQFVISKKT